MSNKYNKKSTYFLDVAQIIATGPQKHFQSPIINPVVPQQSLHSTPMNYPLISQFQRGQPSPYLKQLINPKHYTEIQFFDFTLEGLTQEDLQFEKNYDNSQQQKYCGVIEEVQYQDQKSDLSRVNYSYFQQVPWTLTYLESSKLNMKTFKTKLKQLKNQHRLYGDNEEQIRQFVESYLTEQDLYLIKNENNKGTEAQNQNQTPELPLEELIKIAENNLRNIGPISWLQRKVKVQKYMLKKKNRIWNKKINYDCRKKVAQNRLRVKGKFVTQEQACNLAGVQQDCSIQILKQMLTRRYKSV